MPQLIGAIFVIYLVGVIIMFLVGFVLASVHWSMQNLLALLDRILVPQAFAENTALFWGIGSFVLVSLLYFAQVQALRLRRPKLKVILNLLVVTGVAVFAYH